MRGGTLVVALAGYVRVYPSKKCVRERATPHRPFSAYMKHFSFDSDREVEISQIRKV